MKTHISIFGDVIVVTPKNVSKLIKKYENQLERNLHKVLVKKLYQDIIDQLLNIKKDYETKQESFNKIKEFDSDIKDGDCPDTESH